MLLVQQRPSHLRIGGHSHSRTTCHSHLRGQNGLSAQRNSNGKPLARVKQESGHHSVGLACVLAGLIGFVLPSSAVEDMAASFQKNCAGKANNSEQTFKRIKTSYCQLLWTMYLQSVHPFFAHLSLVSQGRPHVEQTPRLLSPLDSTSLLIHKLAALSLYLSLPDMPVLVLFVKSCQFYQSLKTFCSDV